MQPIGLTQAALAEAMAQRKHVNEMCNNRRSVTAAAGAHLRPRVRQQPDFWLNVQRRTDLWEALNSLASASGPNARSCSARRRDPNHRPEADVCPAGQQEIKPRMVQTFAGGARADQDRQAASIGATVSARSLSALRRSGRACR